MKGNKINNELKWIWFYFVGSFIYIWKGIDCTKEWYQDYRWYTHNSKLWLSYPLAGDG